MQLAASNHLTMEGDDLVYGRSNFATPLKDFAESANKDGLTREQTRVRLVEVLKKHVTTVVAKYRGRVNQWSVVNEYSQYGDDDFYNIIGPKYLEIAFQAARDADPNALLYFNDADNETRNSQNYRRDVAVIAQLRELGLLDAVGLQMHIDAAHPPTEAALAEAMLGYGMPVIVSSMDISLANVGALDGSRWQKQAAIARTVVVACARSGVCHDIYFWDGYGDKYSWLEDPAASGSRASPDADATPFTDEGLYKPMFYAMMAALDQ